MKRQKRTGKLAAFVSVKLAAPVLLAGMEPLGELETTAGKIFSECYALFSGVAFLTSIGLIFAPIFHRLPYKFHFESKED